MIVLEALTKQFTAAGCEKVIADNITATIPAGRSLALIGKNGAGKTSLLKMIAGTMNPDAGRISFTGSVSWPVGFAGSFHPDLTGAQNIRFLARVYGVGSDELIAFVEDFAVLGAHFHAPFRTYSAGMRSRLAFGASMGIGFDTYLVDEVTSVGDAAFKRKSEALFQDRLRNSGAIIVSHSEDLLRRLCDAAAVLHDGRLQFFDTVDTAINHYNRYVL